MTTIRNKNKLVDLCFSCPCLVRVVLQCPSICHLRPINVTYVCLHVQENESTARLKERLAQYTEYELEDVDNTGHCQFDAIAHQVVV